jgi:hypothetical protein
LLADVPEITAITTAELQQGVAMAKNEAKRDPRPRRMDLMIAAIASAHDLPLFTRNIDDFVGSTTWSRSSPSDAHKPRARRSSITEMAGQIPQASQIFGAHCRGCLDLYSDHPAVRCLDDRVNFLLVLQVAHERGSRDTGLSGEVRPAPAGRRRARQAVRSV